MPDSIETATIAALASVSAAAISAAVAFISGRRNAADQKKLEVLKTELLDHAGERSSRRTYEYEARKHLYAEAAPLLFQFYENAAYTTNRIRNLARASREGVLAAWLAEGDRYYLDSTLHSFLAPLASIQLLRDKLTMLDLTLDTTIERQYELGKALNRSFNRDFVFAAAEPAIRYGRKDEGGGFAQGVLAGDVQRAVRCMIITTDSESRVKGFDEFAEETSDAASRTTRLIRGFVAPWEGFTPATRPVFWRIIIAQLFVLRAVRLYPSPDLSDQQLLERIGLSEAERREFTFSHHPDDQAQVEAAYKIGLAFVTNTLNYRDPLADQAAGPPST